MKRQTLLALLAVPALAGGVKFYQTRPYVAGKATPEAPYCLSGTSSDPSIRIVTVCGFTEKECADEKSAIEQPKKFKVECFK